MFVLNLQADTTDSKWKNIIELKKQVIIVKMMQTVSIDTIQQ